MSLNPSALAAAMASGIGQSSPTSELSGFAQGIIEELTSNGVAAQGPQSGNMISGISGSSMATKVVAAAGYGSVSSKLSSFCNGIVSHITSAGMVSYTAPGPGFWNLGGTISGLSGSAMAATVASDVGYGSVSSELSGMCNAICNHIIANGDVEAGVIS